MWVRVTTLAGCGSNDAVISWQVSSVVELNVKDVVHDELVRLIAGQR